MVKYIIVNKIIMEFFMRKSVLLCFALLFSAVFFFSIGASAKESFDYSEKIFAIAHGGNTANYPQNSLEAFEECISLGNIDAVSATVRKTSDGKFVLFEKESTDGICCDENGNNVNKIISETDFSTLSQYRLSSVAEKNIGIPSKSGIAELYDVLNLIDGKMLLIADCDEALLDELYDGICENGFADCVILRCREMSGKELVGWAKENKNANVIPSYDGNVIFSAIGTYNLAKENGISFAEFTVKNQYGVIFSSFFTSRFGSVTALASVYDKNLCAQRPDNVEGWENLLSLGYGAVETGNAAEFSAYLSLADQSLEKLKEVYSQAKKTDISLYTSASANELTDSLEEAEEIIFSKKSVSQNDITVCIDNILNSSSELEKSDEAGGGTLIVTPMKIFWILFAVILFASAEIYIHRKTER